MIYFCIIAFVIEIAVVLFNMTGLRKDISRFQVISMLTGTGFTTIESELILRHPIRRKLSAFLILFGVFSLAVIISSISSMLANEFRSKELSVIAVSLLVIVIFLRIPPLQKRLQEKFNTHLKDSIELHQLPVDEMLFVFENDSFIHVDIYKDSKYIDKTPREFFSLDEDINLLYIKRGEVYIRSERYDTKVHEGDRLLLYGDKEQIDSRFKKELETYKKIHEDMAHESHFL